jgi:hypothetical protein
MPAIQARVRLAFFASGGLKAGTPLLTASMPVNVAHPEENARKTRKTVRGLVAVTGSARIGCIVPLRTRHSPVRIRTPMLAMNQ